MGRVWLPRAAAGPESAAGRSGFVRGRARALRGWGGGGGAPAAAAAQALAGDAVAHHPKLLMELKCYNNTPY